MGSIKPPIMGPWAVTIRATWQAREQQPARLVALICRTTEPRKGG